jgi:cytochrome c peroxidase
MTRILGFFFLALALRPTFTLAAPGVQLAEVLAGANGDSRIQFIELKFAAAGEHLWGPQAGEAQGRYRLVFYDATGAQTGQVVFASDPPVGPAEPGIGGYSVLIATQDFASLPGMPAPDVLIPAQVIAQGGKICFKHNPGNPNAQPVNLCLSYGNFAGSTESDTIGQPSGAPAAAAPIVHASSLRRVANHGNFGVGHFNADFALSAPDPRNSAGQTGAISPAALATQGETLFTRESFLGNGRTCQTCHRPEAHFGLPVSMIATLPPSDPLFVAETNPALAALENPCLLRSRGLFLENIDGFGNPPVFRGSPHLQNTSHTAPYGLSGEFADLRAFSVAAVRQHFPRTMGRNDNPAAGPMDFRLPTPAEQEALEAFMLSIRIPADGNYDIDRMITAAVQRGADAAAIQRGRDLFFGPTAQCFKCHSGPVFAEADVSLGGGNQKFNTGTANLPINLSEPCLGGGPLPAEAGGLREFSTASLIGVSQTAPYFHDHSLATLREAIAFYNTTEFNESPAAAAIGGISLNEPQDVDDLAAFLTALVEPAVVDCNNNQVDDIIDINQGTSLNCNGNSIPDECELAGNDCNANLIPDGCDVLPVRFGPQAPLPASDGPFAVAAVDLNGDQRADLVAANWNAATVSVLLKNAGAGFTVAGSFTVGPLCHAVAPADFDRDGDADVAVPSLSQGSVHVLRNNGVDGLGAWLGFAPGVTYATGAGPLSVVAADLNGDTWPDLASADNIAGTVSVLLNNGESMGAWLGFAPAVTYATGAGTWFITAGRVDADADLDLAVANRSANTARVLWNDGTGAFPTSVVISVGLTPESVAIGDFDGDGLGDVATANFDANTVSLSRNLGGGAFAADIEVGVGFYPFGANPKYVHAVDIDADTDTDLLTANEFSDNVSCLMNNGSGVFNQLVNLSVADAPASLGIGDMDGDGRPDVATSHFVGDRLSYLLNLTPLYGGDCNTNAIPDGCDIASGLATDFNANSVIDACEKLGDIDDDNDLDFADAGLFVAVLLGTDTVPAHVAAADIDGNGTADGRDVRPFVILMVMGV